MFKLLSVGALVLSFLIPSTAPLVAADDAFLGDTQVTMRAKVTEVLSQETRNIPGTDTPTVYQEIRILILSGPEKGTEVVVENDYLELSEGDVFYVTHYTSTLEGRDYYQVSEPYRLTWIFILVALFLLAVAVFGGIQGIRGIVSLVGSLLLIFFVLFPAILAGYSPVLVSIGIALSITTVGSYITHGFNRTTTAAVVGMGITILITGALAFFSVAMTRLSGFTNEETVYLNFSTSGSIDLVGLVLGGILIGLLGVLYDAAIGQAVAVDELYRANADSSRAHVYQRALRIGREHIGALVNTLAIAYVGAALPLLLLFYNSSSESIAITLNRELFATEIVRTVVGSIGVVLAVPITTIVAVILLRNIPTAKRGKGHAHHH